MIIGHAPDDMTAPKSNETGQVIAEQTYDADSFYAHCLGFGTGEIRRIRHLTSDRSGTWMAFIGEHFDGPPHYATHAALYCLRDGSVERVTSGNIMCPQISPDGQSLVFAVSGAAGDEIICLSTTDLSRRWNNVVQGRVEELAWSPSSQKVAARVAGLGADQAGLYGGTMPTLDMGSGVATTISPSQSDDLWRRVWVLDNQGQRCCVSQPRETVWDVAWCGEDALLFVASPDHSENAWYDASLWIVDVSAGRLGERRVIPTQARHQIGAPAASRDGRWIAFVDAVCSDRGLVCGTLCLFDQRSGVLHYPDTDGADVSHVAFRDDGRIHFAGLRSLETIVGDAALDGPPAILWASTDESCGAWNPVSLPIGQHQALVIREGMVRPPEISVLGLPDHDPFGPRSVQTIFATFEQGAAFAQNLQSKTISWLGTDGVRIDGMFLSSAKADGPLPTVVEVHGGPVLADRARWIGHIRTAWLAFNGYGILRCNPRGSCGRGEAFAAALIGDVGGIDMADLLNGVDHLVAAGLADPARLAVTGCSYGGYMSAWLATQNSPFKAAIAISPITHWRSQHGTSQISRFDEIFIADHRQGEARSPVLAVTPSSVPSLLLAGMLDRNTPPSQAQEMHIALRDAGVDTELILYRDGGHSLRDLPIMLDTARRTHAWLVRCGCS